jgi:hypothetical protein
METAIINGKSKSDFKLLLQLAKKLDIKATILTEQEIEDIGLANAMKIGETKEYINVDNYLEKLVK